jgi:quercetin dioxygenase-like cupin family protein
MIADRNSLWTAVLLGGITLALPQADPSPSQGIARTFLQREALTRIDREVVQVRVDFEGGATAALHRHPGDEIVYSLEGRLVYRLAGRAPVLLEAGQVLFIPAETDHEVSNVGPGRAAELATYIVPKGSQLLVPTGAP